MGLSPQAQHRIADWIHALQLVLIIAICVVSAIRMFNKSITSSRNDIWALGVSAKSVIFMAYMVGTEKIAALRRFASTKANFVISIIEHVFWMAVPVLIAMRLNQCVGLGCTYSGIVLGIGIGIALTTFPIVYICWLQWRFFKSNARVSDEEAKAGHNLGYR